MSFVIIWAFRCLRDDLTSDKVRPEYYKNDLWDVLGDAKDITSTFLLRTKGFLLLVLLFSLRRFVLQKKQWEESKTRICLRNHRLSLSQSWNMSKVGN